MQCMVHGMDIVAQCIIDSTTAKHMKIFYHPFSVSFPGTMYLSGGDSTGAGAGVDLSFSLPFPLDAILIIDYCQWQQKMRGQLPI